MEGHRESKTPSNKALKGPEKKGPFTRMVVVSRSYSVEDLPMLKVTPWRRKAVGSGNNEEKVCEPSEDCKGQLVSGTKGNRDVQKISSITDSVDLFVNVVSLFCSEFLLYIHHLFGQYC